MSVECACPQGPIESKLHLFQERLDEALKNVPKCTVGDIVWEGSQRFGLGFQYDSVAGMTCCEFQKIVDDIVTGFIASIKDYTTEHKSPVVMSKLCITRNDSPSALVDMESPPNPIEYAIRYQLDLVGLGY